MTDTTDLKTTVKKFEEETGKLYDELVDFLNAKEDVPFGVKGQAITFLHNQLLGMAEEAIAASGLTEEEINAQLEELKAIAEEDKKPHLTLVH